MDKKLPETATPVENAELARHEAAGLPVRRTELARISVEDLAHADRIEIEGLEVFANHGVYPEENVLGQKFVVSLTLFVDLRTAGVSDDLSASIDYGAVCHDVNAYLCDNTFKLIEAAVEGVASMLLGAYPELLGVTVRLEKPWAPVGLPLKTVAVEITRTR